MVYFLCKVYDSDRQNCYFAQSLPVRGAWIEMVLEFLVSCGSRSLPVRGAWIEIQVIVMPYALFTCRSPCGERGLKCADVRDGAVTDGRSPCGERGLKSLRRAVVRPGGPSLPVRGAWIEISGVSVNS